METKQLFRSVAILLLISSSFLAQTNLTQPAKEYYRAMMTFSPDDLQKSYNTAERIYQADILRSDALFCMVRTQYALLNAAIGGKVKISPNSIIESALNNIDKLGEFEEYAADAEAIKAGIVMMQLVFNPSQAPELSGKVHFYINKALSIDSTNILALLIKGTMIFNTPEMYGGSKIKASEIFQKIVRENNKNVKSFNAYDKVNLLEVYSWLGKSLKALNKLEEAKGIYMKALEIEPKYGWIKYVLLPQLNSQKGKRSTQMEEKCVK